MPTPPERPQDKEQAALVDSRLARVKAGLKLSPEQQSLWTPVEAIVRSMMAKRIERGAELRAEFREMRDKKGPPVDPIARMRERADYMATRAADLHELARAADPLYQSLDAGQKRRFAALLQAEDGSYGRRQGQAGRARARAADGTKPTPEDRSMFDRLRNDIQRGWRELWE